MPRFHVGTSVPLVCIYFDLHLSLIIIMQHPHFKPLHPPVLLYWFTADIFLWVFVQYELKGELQYNVLDFHHSNPKQYAAGQNERYIHS